MSAAPASFFLRSSAVTPDSNAGRAAHVAMLHLAARKLASPFDVRPVPGSESRFCGMRWTGGELLHPMGTDPVQLYMVNNRVVRKLDFAALVVNAAEPMGVETIRTPAWADLVLVCRDEDPKFYASAVRLTMARGARSLVTIVNPWGLTCSLMRYIERVRCSTR